MILRGLRSWLRRSDRGALLALLGWSGCLAACAGAYGLLVGPALRALFGGEALSWPPALAPWLPPPPGVEALRGGLPGIIVGVAALKALARHRHLLWATRLGLAVTARLQGAVHRRLLALPADVARELGAGALVGHVIHDAAAVEQLLVEGYLRRARDGSQVVVLVGVCLLLDWRMAAAGLLVYPLAFWPLQRLRRGLRAAARAGLEAVAGLTGRLGEDLARLPQLQLAGAPDAAAAAFEGQVERAAAARLRAAGLAGLASPLTEWFGALALALVMAWSGARVASGAVAPEHVLGFFVALMLVYEPAKGLARAQAVVEPGEAALARIEALLRRPERLPGGEVGRPPPTGAPQLTLEGVRVRRGGRVVLSVDALRLPAGRLVAVIGPNGAGKTTLAWLLGGLLADWEGQIRVDGAPLEALAPDPWRRSVGWVLGEAYLPRGSLRAAVTGGAPAPAAQLARVAGLAGLEALLGRLPGGWDAPLADGGAGLSSGERQRVALARALWAEPRLLVLDEPEAHLDAAGQADLGALLRGLADGERSVLLLTHSPALAALADQQVRLRDGAHLP